MGDLIVNSVAIVFLMDIDSFFANAFESEAVSKRASTTEFETSWDLEEKKFANGIPRGFDNEIIATFTTVKPVMLVIFISLIAVVVLRTIHCLV